MDAVPPPPSVSDETAVSLPLGRLVVLFKWVAFVAAAGAAWGATLSVNQAQLANEQERQAVRLERIEGVIFPNPGRRGG